jgi:hypothetical protein
MISKYLIDKSQMLQAEQMRGFLHSLQPELENQVKQQLQITKPQHDLQDPYALKDLYKAAGYHLLGSTPVGSMDTIRSDMSLSSLPPADIKTELQSEVQSAIKTAMTEVTEMFKNVFTAQAQLSSSRQMSLSQMHMPNMTWPPPDQSNAGKCSFYGEPGHFMCNCEVVNKYVCPGKCKRNHKNQVVLPSGATVPCINEYHRLNLNQQGAVQMACKVTSATGFVARIRGERSHLAITRLFTSGPQLVSPVCMLTRSRVQSRARQRRPHPHI